VEEFEFGQNSLKLKIPIWGKFLFELGQIRNSKIIFDFSQ